METPERFQALLQSLYSFAMTDLTARREVFATPTEEEIAFDHTLDAAAQELAEQLTHDQRWQLWDIIGQYQQLRQISEWKGFKAGVSLVLRLVDKIDPRLLTNLSDPYIIALLQTR